MKLQPLFGAIAFSAFAAAAQVPADSLWTYADCVDYARAHNISLQQSALSGETAALSLESAKAQWQPTLGFSTTQGYSNSPWSNANKNSYTSNYGLNANWTVWDGGVRENTIKQSKTEVERAGYATENIFRNIQTELLSTYINILYYREAITVNSEMASVSRAQADRAKQMMESGKISVVDYQQLETQAEQDRYNLVSSEASYNTQRMQLKKLLELGIDRQIDVVSREFTDSEVMDPLPSITESYEMALATDAQLKYDKLSIDMAEQDINIAKAGRYPSVALSAGVGTGYYSISNGSWTSQMKEGFNENVGLTVSVPIFDQKKVKTAVSQAKISQLNSELERDARETEIAQTLEGWYIDMQSAQTRYTAGLQNLKSAQLSDDYINERFNVGYVETTELLQSHSTLLSAKHELLQAKYMAVLARKMVEFLRTSQVEL
jgi:outer membrane protein